MIVTGIDPSLRSTGIAVVDTDHQHDPQLATVGSAGMDTDTLAMRHLRLDQLTTSIFDHIHLSSDLVVIEHPAYGAGHSGRRHDRSGAWWLVVNRLHRLRVHVAEVSPPTRAKYATGKGNSGKDEVLACVIRRYRSAVVTNNNEADALVLAAMGARALGGPIEASLPQANLKAMDAVTWPEHAEVVSA